MDWWMLIFAGILEVGWASGLKSTAGFTRLWPSVATILTMAASFWLLSRAIQTIPIGTGYAVWTGIGAVGTVLLGIVVWGDAVSPARIACLAAIVGGIVGLKLLH